MLLRGKDTTSINALIGMVWQSLTYLKSILGFYPFDLLTSVFLDLGLSGLRGLLSSFEAFQTRAMFFRELCNRVIRHRLFEIEGGNHAWFQHIPFPFSCAIC